MNIARPLILASASPRRSHLLRLLGLTLAVRESGVDEDHDVPSQPEEHVRLLSQRKAQAVAAEVRDGIVIGADTVVVLDGEILGKPSSADEAIATLHRLSGRTHTVLTAFTLIDRPSGKSVTGLERTEVTFRALGEEEIRKYVASGSPMDKAGAYGIQDDYGAVFVESIHGCYYNVVGFPLTRFYLTMREFLEQEKTRNAHG